MSDLPATTMLMCASRHRDLLRLVTLLAITNALVRAATPAAPSPPSPSSARYQQAPQSGPRDLDRSAAGLGPAPADCVLGVGSRADQDSRTGAKNDAKIRQKVYLKPNKNKHNLT